MGEWALQLTITRSQLTNQPETVELKGRALCQLLIDTPATLARRLGTTIAAEELDPGPAQPVAAPAPEAHGLPHRGNRIGLVSDWPSRPLMEHLAASMKQACRLPVVTLAVPFEGHILPEVRLSDHASFWDAGYPAIMLTDTAFMRNPNYHGPGDVMEHLDLPAMTELTLGLVNFIAQQGQSAEKPGKSLRPAPGYDKIE